MKLSACSTTKDLPSDGQKDTFLLSELPSDLLGSCTRNETNETANETNDALRARCQKKHEERGYLRHVLCGLDKENMHLHDLLHKRSKENMYLRNYVWGLEKEGNSLRLLLKKKHEENASLWESDKESASLFYLYQEKLKFTKSFEAFERRHSHSSRGSGGADTLGKSRFTNSRYM